jgi:peptidoglycan biosynthesis protein MviN/MurJ (putative lipid II flippase)
MFQSHVPVTTNQITIIFPLLLVYSPKNIPLSTITNNYNQYIQPAIVPVTTNQMFIGDLTLKIGSY